MAWSLAAGFSADTGSLGTGLVVPLAGSAALTSGRGLATGAGVSAPSFSAFWSPSLSTSLSATVVSRVGAFSSAFWSSVEPVETFAACFGSAAGAGCVSGAACVVGAGAVFV